MLNLKTETDYELLELLAKTKDHVMSGEEIEAQRQSFKRALQPCEHGIYDFETCSKCRGKSK